MSTEHSGRSHGAAAPRTLADDLRTRDDAALAGLLRTRPDLLSPVPNDLTQLATRAGTRASVVRAVERLDRFALQTAEAIAVAPDPCTYGVLEALLTGDPGAVDPETAEAVAAELPRALRTLREQALLWGGEDRLHLVRTVRELLSPTPSSPSPTGLGPTLAEATAGMSPGRLQDILATVGLPATHDPVSALAGLVALFADRARTEALLEGAPVESLAMLEKLRWGPPYGSVQTDSPSAPVTWLLDRGLLVRTAPRTVVLPREVALHLRAGRAHREVEPLPPAPVVRREYPPETADETAAGQALAALGTLEDLLSSWETEPPSVLRAGGLGVRDLKRTATALDLPEPTAVFWIELAYAAGLLASDNEPDECYAPTPAYDEWLRLPAHERWSHVVLRWLTGTRVPGLVGTRDAKGRGLAALGQGLDRGLTADVRRRTLELLAGLAPGAAPAQQSVLARLRWERPL
ncbi:DNA-binding protein, partial [Streptomyces nanshensis]